MKNNLQNFNSSIEKKIDWNAVQSTMKEKLGQDIFESWLKKIELIDEFNNYILISVSTRFIRDWITSRYLDQILGIVRKHKKDIIRIEFLIEDKNKVVSQKTQNTENFLIRMTCQMFIPAYITFAKAFGPCSFTLFVRT